MLSEVILLIATVVAVYFGATFLERDRHREREAALLDALDDAVATIHDLNDQAAAIARHPSVRRLGVIDGGAS